MWTSAKVENATHEESISLVRKHTNKKQYYSCIISRTCSKFISRFQKFWNWWFCLM